MSVVKGKERNSEIWLKWAVLVRSLRERHFPCCPYVGANCPYLVANCPCVGATCPFLGANCPYVGAACPYLGANCPYTWAPLVPIWVQIVPTCAPVVPNWAPIVPILAPVVSTWALSVPYVYLMIAEVTVCHISLLRIELGSLVHRQLKLPITPGEEWLYRYLLHDCHFPLLLIGRL